MEWQSCQAFSRRRKKYHHSCLTYFCTHIFLTYLSVRQLPVLISLSLLPFSRLSFSFFLPLPMKDHKTYVDKGVQTGSRVDRSPLTLPCSDAPCIQRALDDSQSSDFCSSRFSDCSGAYIDSDASLSDRSRHIPQRHTINSQRAMIYSHLGCGRPYHLASTNDRIMSLPETSPPFRIAQPPGRLVSMPEALETVRYSHDHSQSLLGSEPSDTSLASNGITQTNIFQGDHAFLGGVPRTPSPPSSPDSVVIIGNEDQVPRVFLRSKSTVDDNDLHGMS